jgi:hypothetical protein
MLDVILEVDYEYMGRTAELPPPFQRPPALSRLIARLQLDPWVEASHLVAFPAAIGPVIV